MPWTTLLDEFNRTGRVPDELGVEDRGGDVPHIRCGCQRVVPADMMYRLADGWACDGCVGTEQRKRGIGRRAMTDVLGGKRSDSPRPTRPYMGRGRTALDVED